MRKLITLITDFGTRDGYAGVLKGVVYRDAPEIDVVEITHEISPFHVGQGAFAIFNVHRWYPKGTVHVIVVDPGVGSERNILLMEAASQYFIAPDNGVLDAIAFLYEDRKVQKILPEKFSNVSSTFHGRDIFVPAAIKLLKGENIREFCEESVYQYRLLTDEMRDGREAVFLHADHFGNIITSLIVDKADPMTLQGLRFNQIDIPFVRFYEEGSSDRPVCLFGSTGLLEVAIRQGNAAEYFQKRWGGLPARFEIIRK